MEKEPILEANQYWAVCPFFARPVNSEHWWLHKRAPSIDILDINWRYNIKSFHAWYSPGIQPFLENDVIADIFEREVLERFLTGVVWIPSTPPVESWFWSKLDFLPLESGNKIRDKQTQSQLSYMNLVQ